jgi:hypothetical protein
MEATHTRARLLPAGEWVVAAIFLAATLGVGLLLLGALRSNAVAPVPGSAGTVGEVSALPQAVPPNAVSVPSLLLHDGKTMKVGDDEAHVGEMLRGATIERSTEDAGALGRRVTRAYEYRGTRFLVVFEPFERRGGLRVAGIYLN